MRVCLVLCVLIATASRALHSDVAPAPPAPSDFRRTESARSWESGTSPQNHNEKAAKAPEPTTPVGTQHILSMVQSECKLKPFRETRSRGLCVVVHESGCVSALTFFLLANLAKLPAGMKDPGVHEWRKHAAERSGAWSHVESQPRTPTNMRKNERPIQDWACPTKPVLATFLNLFCRKLIW